MKFRLTAFGLHLAGSASALTLVLGGFYLGWYRWPGWYLTSVAHVVVILAIVDVALGPTLTLIIASPSKPRRELVRDIAVIVTVQLAALVYGATTLWRGRPLYYTFSVNRLELVQASAVDSDEIALARRQNPLLAPYWYDRPRWIWAPLPENPEEAAKIAEGTIFGGKDVIEMPRYFKPWEQGLPKLHDQLRALDQMKELTQPERQSLSARLSRLGIPPDQSNAALLWGDVRRVLVVFDPATLRIKAILMPG
jgi:hypothetical protein